MNIEEIILYGRNFNGPFFSILRLKPFDVFILSVHLYTLYMVPTTNKGKLNYLPSCSGGKPTFSVGQSR